MLYKHHLQTTHIILIYTSFLFLFFISWWASTYNTPEPSHVCSLSLSFSHTHTNSHTGA